MVTADAQQSTAMRKAGSSARMTRYISLTSDEVRARRAHVWNRLVDNDLAFDDPCAPKERR